MDDAVRTQLENRVHKIEEGHYELSSSMESISKDMHVLSTTLVELKDVMKSLAQRDVEFQLFKQKTDQNVDLLFDDIRELKANDKQSPADIEKMVDMKLEDTNKIIATNFKYILIALGAAFSLSVSYIAYMDFKFDNNGESLSKIENIVVANDEKLKSNQTQVRDLYFDVKEIRSILLKK